MCSIPFIFALVTEDTFSFDSVRHDVEVGALSAREDDVALAIDVIA